MRLVAVVDKRLAARQGVVHALALALAQDRLVTTLTAGHGAVVGVLGVAISETVADEDTLQVDVSVLVRQNLRGKDWNVMTGIRFASNVEILLGILRELVEEEAEKGIYVLSGSHGVADGASAVRVANVDGLVKEDDGSVVVPRVWVIHQLNLLVDGGRAELQEETGQRGAARAAVEPKDDGVVLRVIARLEEPWGKKH